MYKTSYIIILLFFCSSVKATVINNDSLHQGFFIGLNFSPNYNHYSFLNEDGSGTYFFKYKERVNYSYGITLKYRFKKRISLGSSILYSEKGFDKVYDQYFITTTGEISVVKMVYKVGYLELPLLFDYTIYSNKRINITIGTGICVGRQINLNSMVYFEDNRHLFLKGKSVDLQFQSYQLYTPVNIGFEYYFSHFLSMSLTPFWHYEYIKMSGYILNNSFAEGVDFKLLYHF